MKVILLQDVEKLGKEGELVIVKNGYARNYLLPRKLASLSTPEALRMLERKRKKRQQEQQRLKEQAQTIAGKISSFSCTLAMEAGVEDKIFGAVTTDMIRNAMKQEGIEIDKRNIVIAEPIKKLGVYQVSVKVHSEVSASLRIWVVKK